MKTKTKLPQYEKDIRYLLRKLNSPETNYEEVLKINKQLDLLYEQRKIHESK